LVEFLSHENSNAVFILFISFTLRFRTIVNNKQQSSPSTRPSKTVVRRLSPCSTSFSPSSPSPPRLVTAAAATSGDNSDASNVMASNPLFANNPAFAAVLADSLNRQGADALTSGEESTGEDEDREGAIEEMLASCMRDQRQAVVQLEHLEKAVKEALVRERKQFERLQFAFKKAASDRAFAQSIAKLRKR